MIRNFVVSGVDSIHIVVPILPMIIADLENPWNHFFDKHGHFHGILFRQISVGKMHI